MCIRDRYNRSLLTGEFYSHKYSLPQLVATEIKPVFRDLSNPDLLSDMPDQTNAKPK